MAPLISLLVAAVFAAGIFIPIQGKLLLLPPPVAHRIFGAVYLHFAMDIAKFFASVLGMSLASGAISAEIERGVLSAILPKPITRFSVYAGKWIGIFLFVATTVVLWDVIIWVVLGYRDPEDGHQNVWRTLPYLLLYPTVFVTLALAFSTMASFSLAIGLSILAGAVGWAQIILYNLGKALLIHTLDDLAILAGWLVPIGRMARWVQFSLGPLQTMDGRDLGVITAFSKIPATTGDLVYIGVYVVVVFTVGAIVFARRDI